MHTSISAIQLIRVFIIHGVPVGQLVGSDYGLLNFLQMVLADEGNREAVENTAGGELWFQNISPD